MQFMRFVQFMRVIVGTPNASAQAETQHTGNTEQ